MKMHNEVGILFDYAAEHADGFTYVDVERDLGWRKPRFTKVHRQLRLMLGNDDSINLVCTAQGQHQPWLYQLVGNVDDARYWISNRVRDCESRIVTILAVVSSLVAATDSRSNDGRRVRIMTKGLSRIIEDLAELQHGPKLW